MTQTIYRWSVVIIVPVRWGFFSRTFLVWLLSSLSGSSWSTPVSSSFVGVAVPVNSRRSSAQTMQQLHSTRNFVLKASPSRGSGIPTLPAGGKHLFDPAQEGKLAGTSQLDDRIAKGSAYWPLADDSSSSLISSSSPGSPSHLEDAQHWLEDIGIPRPFAKPTAPITATVLARVKLITDDAPGDIQHIVLQLPETPRGRMRYIEGQSLSVIPPGVDARTGKPHAPRLYSIASTRYGDLLDGNTVSLCVRRAQYIDPETGKEDPSKCGVCSNYLCNVQVGDLVSVAGPVGTTFILPPTMSDPKTSIMSSRDLILVATGTGIAPFRAFLHRLFMENTVARHLYNGHAWLILGVPVSGGLLYPQELDAMKEMMRIAQNNEVEHIPDRTSQLEVSYAISREMTNVATGEKLYVQHILQDRADELWERLNQGALIYFCGLKGMMPGILEAMDQVAQAKGIDWSQRLFELKANNQWHVEVY